MNPSQDDYSAFAGCDEHGTTLADLLGEQGITTLYIGGLATDYCVKETVLAARQEDFTVFFLADASRGVDINSGDSGQAVAEMAKAGAITTSFTHVAVQSF
jgi:nicotinamidase/pyrazinamidase